MIFCFAYSPVDQTLAEKSSAWIAELGKNTGHRSVIVNDRRCNPNLVRSIEHNLKLAFDSVETVTVNDGIDGWPLAANIVFRTVAKHIQFTNPEPWLFFEADAVALKAGFMDALEKDYNEGLKAGRVFLGDFVNVKDVVPHCSGVAVYPGVVVDHAPYALHAREVAWDCFSANQIVPKMRTTRLIAHRWHHPPITNDSELDNLLGQFHPDCAIFHQCKTGAIIDLLRKRTGSRSTGAPEQADRLVDSRSGSIPDARATSTLPADQSANTGSVGAGKGIVDIFIKTYPKDYEWLSYCLHSIDSFASGFRKTVIISPDELPWDFVNFKSKFEIQTRFPHGMGNVNHDGYLDQQAFKMYADTYSDADYICLIDSDTIFTHPVTPETYFKDGKPIWMMTPIDQAHPNESHAWREVMEKFMGKKAEFEFMRRFPFMVPRWAFQAFRDFCKEKHGMELKDYIMAQPYRQFSEFNCLGFYLYEFHRDKFHWVDTSSMPESEWPPLTVDQRWSHGELPKEEWEKILAGGVSSQGGAECVAPSNGADGLCGPTAPPTPSLSDEIRYHTARLNALTEGMQGRKQMVLTELRKLGLAPKAKKR